MKESKENFDRSIRIHPQQFVGQEIQLFEIGLWSNKVSHQYYNANTIKNPSQGQDHLESLLVVELNELCWLEKGV